MAMKYVLCLAVLAVSLRIVRAHISRDTDMAVMDYVNGTLQECYKEFNLDVEHRKSVEDVNCLTACILNKKGVLNGEGKFDADKTIEILVEVVKNYEDYKALETVVKSCASVNAEKVSDEVEGCERAGLLISCVSEHKTLHK